MLDDSDRNFQYSAAIAACITDFKAEQGFAPRVLDIGVGTGMLSALCLIHGAKHVTGVDVNDTMVSLAKTSLRTIDPNGKQHKVILVKPGPSQLGDQKFDMVVSEILGTLSTSESMYKYVSIYKEHLNTFGDDHKVYAVPQRTTQYVALRAFSRRDMGAPLVAAIEVALRNRESLGRFVPTNEGGLALPLYLYESTLIGERIPIHTESYETLAPNDKGVTAFGVVGPDRAVQVSADALTAAGDDAFFLAVLEWVVDLWRGTELHNTLDKYKEMELRNALARASAWGFFVADVPSLAPSNRADAPAPAPRAALTVKACRMNAAAGQGTPVLDLDGTRVTNVCEEPMTFVVMAADTHFADRLRDAVRAAFDAMPPLDTDRPRRVLVVNDSTGGRLPMAAAAMGARVDVVNEDALATYASQMAESTVAASAAASASSKAANSKAAKSKAAKSKAANSRTAPKLVAEWFVGRVATGSAESRKTRGAFVPDASYEACYDVIVHGSALVDASRCDKHRIEQLNLIAQRWLRAGGVRVPSVASCYEREHAFDAESFYGASVPDARLRQAGVQGALRALGEPCIADDGGALLSTNDDGLVFHGLHAIDAAESGSARPLRPRPPPNHAVAAAPEPAPASIVRAGVKECMAHFVLPWSGDCIAPPLCSSLAEFQKLNHFAVAEEVRSAAARATYAGVQLRLNRQGPNKAKVAKTSA